MSATYARELRRKMLFWNQAGPQIDYTEDGVLHMATLNPECEIEWRMSRLEMFHLGLHCIMAAFWMR
jgi:hypothetical protein